MNDFENEATYFSEKVVRHYTKQTELQKPEKSILSFLLSKLKEMKMLDIGIGGGRTTRHFAPLVKNYTGIDYSKKMIDFCRHHYAGLNANLVFQTLDLRSLGQYADNEFDFVLISYNSLDYINETERASVLKEIRRIVSSPGFFCFSTHNTRSLDKLFKFKLRKNLVEIAKNIYKRAKLKRINENFSSKKHNKYTVINDGAHNFGLNTFYIQPEEQIQQLSALGFTNIRVFDLENGTEILDAQVLLGNTDFYLYYLCSS